MENTMRCPREIIATLCKYKNAGNIVFQQKYILRSLFLLMMFGIYPIVAKHFKMFSEMWTMSFEWGSKQEWFSNSFIISSRKSGVMTESYILPS